ncbi:Anaphase-promoting complex subunit 10 [Apophysomyces ossiformis]|uniref:Anaphase-promoting complex subunit 10 n=1 Tax=Apophysomyces ossiformis TaxID=679940 RepID=A0A8H7BW59_9FUNG|nr:Anaphase-promoting complex subunit 10 [Apophysomyces ossiformis]
MEASDQSPSDLFLAGEFDMPSPEGLLPPSEHSPSLAGARLTTEFFPSDPPTEEEEEEEEEGEEEEDEEDRKLDDSEQESRTLRIYEETHPDHTQKQSGGREIADHEAIWSVSTFRQGWGIQNLRDNNPLTFWQSDSQNPLIPHTIDLVFLQATLIKQVSLFIDYFQDESYTPMQVSIRGGTTCRDLQEIMRLECEETVGWQNADFISVVGEPLRIFRLQIAILNTRLSGRDTHVRQVKVYHIPLPYLEQQQQQYEEKQKQKQKEKEQQQRQYQEADVIKTAPRLLHKGLR